jgi:hypothetical protein
MSDFEQENQGEKLIASAPDTSSEAVSKTNYKVGYKRPPRHTRFKPGQSGNPRGRPKGTPNHRTTVSRVMNEKVSVRDGDKTRRITKFEAILQAHTLKSMKADARSGALVMNIMSRMGLVNEEEKTPEVAIPQQSPPKKSLPADPYFEGVDLDRLSDDEQRELGMLADRLDNVGDLVRLRRFNRAYPERFMDLIDKARGERT